MKFAIAVLQTGDTTEIISASSDIGAVLDAYRTCVKPGKLFYSDKIQWDRSKRVSGAPAEKVVAPKKKKE